jgi:hypothetical protein
VPAIQTLSLAAAQADTAGSEVIAITAVVEEVVVVEAWAVVAVGLDERAMTITMQERTKIVESLLYRQVEQQKLLHPSHQRKKERWLICSALMTMSQLQLLLRQLLVQQTLLTILTSE